MKLHSNFRVLVLLALALAFGGVRAHAFPTSFKLSVLDSTNLFFTNTTVTTTITVVNDNGTSGTYLTNTYVTNAFSGPVNITGFTNSNDSDVTNLAATTNGDILVFNFQNFTNGQEAQIIFTWQPLAVGPLTNTIVVSTSDNTNTVGTNLLYQVYAFQADLAVSMAYVSQAYVTNDYWVITNDWVTYEVTVTNPGPSTAFGVQLTNVLPAGVMPVSPAAQSYLSNTVVYAVNTLAGGTSASYQFTVQPTNAGAFTLLASAGAPEAYNPDPTNAQALEDLFVTNYLAGTFLTGTNSGQIVNQLNGLIEQTIQVMNTGAAVPAVRVVVTGLTNQLFNASGTNNGQPFVVCPAALPSGSPVGMRLQYNPRLPFHLTNGQFQAFALPATVLNYTPPPAAQWSTNLNVSRMARLTDGDMLLEFTNLGGSYTVVYSDNALFTNAMIATPAVTTTANRFIWLDYGPPETARAPTNSNVRFYRVIQNP